MSKNTKNWRIHAYEQATTPGMMDTCLPNSSLGGIPIWKSLKYVTLVLFYNDKIRQKCIKRLVSWSITALSTQCNASNWWRKIVNNHVLKKVARIKGVVMGSDAP